MGAPVSADELGQEGWDSKKLAFGLLSVVLIFVGWLMSAHWLALGPQFMTMVGGITGIYALFVGGNIGNKLVASKHLVAMAAAGQTVEDTSEEVETVPGTGGSAR